MELLAGVGGEEFLEPRFAGGLVFGGDDFYNIAAFERSLEVGHFAVDFDAGGLAANLAVDAVSKI